MTKKNLIYTGCFFNETYVQMLDLFFESIIKYGKINFKKTRILVMTDNALISEVKKLYEKFKLRGDILIFKKITNVFEVRCARLHIFKYPELYKYKKILWLDCDILVTNNLSNILKYEPHEKLYVASEGNTFHQFWGRWLYDYNKTYNPEITGFTNAVILFNNCEKMKTFFNTINKNISELRNSNKWNHAQFPLTKAYCDKPFIVYHAIENNMYDQKLQEIIVDNPTTYEGFTVAHFTGDEERLSWLGKKLPKHKRMKEYMKICNSTFTPNIVPSIQKVDIYANNIDDIIIDTNSKTYLELSSKIKTIKKRGLPLLIKVNSHPCSGKSTFIKSCDGYYNGCKMYDFDSFPEEKNKTSDMLLDQDCNSILFGCSGGGLDKQTFERDYDIHENVIYIFVFPKLKKLYKHIVRRQFGWRARNNSHKWTHPKRIFNYRNNMYKLIIRNQQQIRPLFYSFNEGINYCIQEYNKLPNCNI